MTPVAGQLLALITASCWAHNSIMYSEAGKRVGSSTVAHIRLWIAFPVIILIHLLFTGSFFPVNLPSRSLIYLFLSGVLGFCISDLFIFRALVDLGPRETLVVLTLSPIFSTLVSWFTLQEKLPFLQIAGIVTTVMGVIWVIFSENRELKKRQKTPSGSGLAFALTGTLCQSMAMVLAKAALSPGIHPVSANLLRISGGLIGLIIFALARKSFVTDFKKMKDRRALLYLASGSLVGPVLGIILMMYALLLAPVGIVSALSQISPVLLLPFDKFVSKKTIPLGAVAGTIVAIGGTIMLFIY